MNAGAVHHGAWLRGGLRCALLTACIGSAHGCAVGPRYEPTPAVDGATSVGAARALAPTRAFFDSLAAARAADSQVARLSGGDAPAPRALPVEDLGWIEILKDSVLTRLVQAAVAQNRDLVGARARIQEFRAGVGTARAPLFPALTVNASASRNRVVFGNFPAALFNAFTVTGDVAWEVDVWGGTRRGLEAANADLEAQAAAERGRVLALVSEVASAYLQLLALDQEHAIAEETLASRRVTLDLARQRLDQGVISELDVDQFEAQVAVPAIALAEVQQLQALQESALSQLVGAPPMRIPRGGSLRDAVIAVTVPDSLPAELLARRPDVQRTERAYAAASARIGVADAARMPAIAIGGSYGGQAGDLDLLFDSGARVWRVQGGLSFPAFTGGRLESGSRAARARADQARAEYEQTSLIALREATDALTGVRAGRDLVAAEQTRAEALRRALDLAERRYAGGISSYMEVLDAQRSLFDAEVALNRAELRQLIAAVQLYKALGGTWTPAEEPAR